MVRFAKQDRSRTMVFLDVEVVRPRKIEFLFWLGKVFGTLLGHKVWNNGITRSRNDKQREETCSSFLEKVLDRLRD